MTRLRQGYGVAGEARMSNSESIREQVTKEVAKTVARATLIG